MSSPNDKTKVVELTSVPQMDTGAPLPFLFAAEDILRLCYYLSSVEEAGLPAKGSDVEWYVVADFHRPFAHLFGPPNDEALSGHPLHSFGLEPYAVFEVRPSPWIADLEAMNRVHPRHDASRYAALRHYVFTFHDSIFECVAESFTVDRRASTPKALLSELFEPQPS